MADSYQIAFSTVGSIEVRQKTSSATVDEFEYTQWPGYSPAAQRIVFSGDGKWLFGAANLAAYKQISFKRDGVSWPVKNINQVTAVDKTYITSSKDGTGVLVCTATAAPLYFPVVDGVFGAEAALPSTMRTAALSPSGEYLVATPASGVLSLFKKESGVFTLKGASAVTGTHVFPQFSPDGRFVAVAILASPSSGLYIYEIVNDALVQRSAIEITQFTAVCLAWSADGSKIVLGSSAATKYAAFSVNSAGAATRKTTNLATIPATPNAVVFAPNSSIMVFALSVAPWTSVVKIDATTDAHTLGNSIDGISSAVSSLSVTPFIVYGVASTYDAGLAAFLSGNVAAANLKILLLSSAASFNAAATTLTEVTNAGANEVTFAEWPAGGFVLAGLSANVDPVTKDIRVNFSETGPNNATTAPLFRYALIYDNADAGKRPIFFLDLLGERAPQLGGELKFASGPQGLLFADR